MAQASNNDIENFIENANKIINEINKREKEDNEVEELVDQTIANLEKAVASYDGTNLSSFMSITSSYKQLFLWYLNNKPKESKDVAIKMLQLCDQNSKNSHKIKSIHLGWIYDQYDEKIEILLSQNKFQLLVKICIAYKEFLEKQNDINGNLYAIIRFYIGKCYAGLEKNKDAAKEFNEALKLLDPNDSCLNLNREDFFKRQIVYAGIKEDFGIMQMKMKKFDEAVGNFKEALTIYELQDTSKYVYLNFRLGFIALLQHDYTSGIDRIKTMIEKKKDDINFDKYPQIYHLLGILYSRVKNYDESIKWLEENIRVPQNLWDNDWQDPICQLGEIYRKSGKSEKAIELFREYNRKIYEQDKLEFNLNGCFGLSCSSLDEDGNDVLFNDECVPGINFLFEKAKEIPSEFENHKQLPPTTVQQLSNNQIYEMNSNNEYRRGICIIINNISFQAPNKWRDGSNMDALRLIDLFYKLKFKIIVKNDCLKEETLSKLNKIATSDWLESFDSLVCITLSHGANNQIHDVDDVSISPYDIFDIFSDKKCLHMVNKPKIFIFQSCRGKKSGKYISARNDSSNEPTISTNEADMQKAEIAISVLNDMFIWYSTIEGNKLPKLFISLNFASVGIAFIFRLGLKPIKLRFVSYRDETRGSIFIEILVQVVEKHTSNTKLVDIAKIVESQMRLVKIGRDCRQTTSTVTFGWCKDFYFKKQ